MLYTDSSDPINPLDAVSTKEGEIRPIPKVYKSVYEYKPADDGGPGRCWVKTKADESSLGLWATLWNWWSDMPIFYTKSSHNPGPERYEELGTPIYIVFKCKEATSPIAEPDALQECLPGDDTAKYSMLRAAEFGGVLCPEALDFEKQMYIGAETSKFHEDDNPRCKAVRYASGTLVQDRMTEAYKKDGEQAFCSWMADVVSRKSDQFWRRFLAAQ